METSFISPRRNRFVSTLNLFRLAVTIRTIIPALPQPTIATGRVPKARARVRRGWILDKGHGLPSNDLQEGNTFVAAGLTLPRFNNLESIEGCSLMGADL